MRRRKFKKKRKPFAYKNREDTDQYKKWRAAVRKRDKYRCQFPDCKNTTLLQVHHIQKWSSSPDIRFAVDNGITLCRTHHDAIKGQEEAFAPLFLKLIRKTTRADLKIKRMLLEPDGENTDS